MNRVACALAIVFATCPPTYAQSGVVGTWRAEEVGSDSPWEVVLRADGPRLTGLVSQCAFRASEVFEGRIDGNTITFTCKRMDHVGTVALKGTINGDQIAFTWELQPGTPPVDRNDRIFGSSTPLRFIATRVPDGGLARSADQVGGVELSTTLNLLQKNMRVTGTLFLPHKVSRVRAVIVVLRWGNGSFFYPAQDVRRLAETTDSALLLTDFATMRTPIDQVPRSGGPEGADGLLLLLQRLAQESGHQELADAPLLLWGHSAGGAFAASFAALYPRRTIAFVGYHGWPDVLSQVPALLFAGAKDAQVPAPIMHARWKAGRAAGAPWTFSLDPDADHGSEKSLTTAKDLMIPWMTAVLRQRLSPDGKALRAVTDGSAWVGNNQTGEAAPYGTFPGSKLDASWLPDEPSARGWRVVLGAVK